MKSTIKVFIADNQLMYKLGLKSILKSYDSLRLVGEDQYKENWVADIIKYQPDVVLIDLESDSATVAKTVLEAAPQTAIVLLSYAISNELVLHLLDVGALGFVSKHANPDEIVEAIENAYLQKPYFCKISAVCLTNIVAKNYQLPHKITANFTERELQIIERICDERTSKEIASELHLSKRTVEGHRTRIMLKVGAKCSAGIVTYALSNGIYQRTFNER